MSALFTMEALFHLAVIAVSVTISVALIVAAAIAIFNQPI